MTSSFRQPDEIGGGGGVYHGRDGVVRGVQQLLDVLTSFVLGITSLCSCGYAVAGRAAACRLTCLRPTSGDLGADRWTFGTRTSTATRPSKPWGWRSRRCLTS